MAGTRVVLERAHLTVNAGGNVRIPNPQGADANRRYSVPVGHMPEPKTGSASDANFRLDNVPRVVNVSLNAAFNWSDRYSRSTPPGVLFAGQRHRVTAGEMTMYIHWDSKLETGHPLVDAEHRILVLLFRKLDVAIKTYQSEETIEQIIQELRKFVEFHFLSEENLMRETLYPGLEAHRALHTELLMRLGVFIAKVVARREFPEDLVDFLNRWLLEHIARHDQYVAQHVRNAVSRPIAESAYAEYLGGLP